MTILGIFNTVMVVERKVTTPEGPAGIAKKQETRNMFVDNVDALTKDSILIMEAMMEGRLREEANEQGFGEYVKVAKATGINFIKMDDAGLLGGASVIGDN